MTLVPSHANPDTALVLQQVLQKSSFPEGLADALHVSESTLALPRPGVVPLQGPARYSASEATQSHTQTLSENLTDCLGKADCSRGAANCINRRAEFLESPSYSAFIKPGIGSSPYLDLHSTQNNGRFSTLEVQAGIQLPKPCSTVLL